MPSFGPRMVCTRCGIIGADVRPNWREQAERPSPHGNAMAKLKMPADAAKALTVPERLLLLCVASGIDFRHAKIADRVATEMVVKDLIERDAGGHLALTDRGRVVLRAMLPDL